MHSILLWPALVVMAGVVTFVPAVEDGENRSILYWLVVPTLVVGAAAIFTHIGSF